MTGTSMKTSVPGRVRTRMESGSRDRKSTRLNSSHLGISYAVFCLKKKKKRPRQHTHANRKFTQSTPDIPDQVLRARTPTATLPTPHSARNHHPAALHR